MCIDFRELNKNTIPEHCLPPTIEEVFANLGNSSIYSTLDLEMGYHQVVMDKECKDFTSFTTSLGKFKYRMMPFGLRNAPSHFQNFMFIVLQKLIGKNVQVYMDDIIIATKSMEEHYRILREVLTTLGSFGWLFQ